MQNFRALGAPPPDPQNSPPHCEFLATRLKEVSKNYDQAVKLWCDKIENAICENPNSAKFYGFAKIKLNSRRRYKS